MHSDYLSEYRKKNLEVVRAGNRTYMANDRAIDPEKYRERYKEYAQRKRRQNPNWKRDRHLMTLYGITVAQRDEMLIARGRICDLCLKKMPDHDGVTGPVIDHNHTTGKIRGILHSDCNRALGLLKEDITALQRAPRYILTDGKFNDWTPGIGEGLL